MDFYRDEVLQQHSGVGKANEKLRPIRKIVIEECCVGGSKKMNAWTVGFVNCLSSYSLRAALGTREGEEKRQRGR